MKRSRYTPEETVRRGEELYEQKIRALVEPTQRGKYIVIDVETGGYEVGDDYLALSRRALARDPNAPLCALRIGYPALGRVGGQLSATNP
jgi:hypothetical protein